MEGLFIYHVIIDRGRLRVFDSGVERFSVDCLPDGLSPGHYKLPFIERLPHRTKFHGPGRMYLADLTQRDVKALQEDEWAEVTLDDRVKIGNVVGSIGRLKALGDTKISIHGGAESLSWSLGQSNFQPLTPMKLGVRVHNGDLVRLMSFLELRLFCGQLVVVTITP